MSYVDYYLPEISHVLADHSYVSTREHITDVDSPRAGTLTSFFLDVHKYFMYDSLMFFHFVFQYHSEKQASHVDLTVQVSHVWAQ